MGEFREWVELLLLPVLIPMYFAARKAWRQWKAKRDVEKKRTRRETRRADTYETEGTEAIDTLAFENQELQLENESLHAKNTSLTESVAKLSDAYHRLAHRTVVES